MPCLEGGMFVYSSPLWILAAIFHCKLRDRFPVLPQHSQKDPNLVVVIQLQQFSPPENLLKKAGWRTEWPFNLLAPVEDAAPKPATAFADKEAACESLTSFFSSPVETLNFAGSGNSLYASDSSRSAQASLSFTVLKLAAASAIAPYLQNRSSSFLPRAAAWRKDRFPLAPHSCITLCFSSFSVFSLSVSFDQ